MNKAVLVFILFLLLAGPAFSLSITAPSKVTERSNFSVDVDFSPMTFDKGTVSMNGELLINIFPFNGGTEAVIRKSSSKVLSSEITGTTLTLSIQGLSAGTGAITAESYSGGSSSGTTSASVTFFSPLDDSFRTQVESDITAVEGNIDSLEQDLSSTSQNLNDQISSVNDTLSNELSQANDRASQLEENLAQSNATIEEVRNSLNETNDSLESFKTQQTENDAAVMESIKDLYYDVDEAKRLAMEGELQANATGFATAGNSPLVGVLLIALLVLIIALYVEFKREGVFDSFAKQSNDLPNSKRENSDEEDSDDDSDSWRGKWSVKPPHKEKEKGIALGDLIKKRK